MSLQSINWSGNAAPPTDTIAEYPENLPLGGGTYRHIYPRYHVPKSEFLNGEYKETGDP